MPSIYVKLKQPFFPRNNSRTESHHFGSSLLAIERWKVSLKDLFVVRSKADISNTSTPSLASPNRSTEIQRQAPKIVVHDTEELKALETLYNALHHPSILDARRHQRYDLYPLTVSVPSFDSTVPSIVESQETRPLDIHMTKLEIVPQHTDTEASQITYTPIPYSDDSSYNIKDEIIGIAVGDISDAVHDLTILARSSSAFVTDSSDVTTSIVDLARVLNAADMKVLRFLGEGTTGKVYYVEDRVSEVKVALKVIPKEDKNEYTLGVIHDERDISEKLSDSPWFVNLYCSWHDHKYLYIAMTAYPTDLDSELIKYSKLEPTRARFYMAEIIIALTELHSRGIIHRDIKAPNILIDREGHVVLADFGLSKDFHQIPSIAERVFQPYWPYLPHDSPNIDAEPRDPEELCFVAWDYRGSELEMAPEVHLREPYSFGVDFWSAAVVLYWMVTGRPPWYEEEEDDDIEVIDDRLLALKIVEDELYWDPADDVDDATKDFLTRMLMKDPRKRLMISYEIPAHPYFAQVNWPLMEARKVPPPWIPDAEICHAYEESSPTFTPVEPYSTDEYDPYPEFNYLSQEAQRRVIHIVPDFNRLHSFTYPDDDGFECDNEECAQPPHDEVIHGPVSNFDYPPSVQNPWNDQKDCSILPVDSIWPEPLGMKEGWDVSIVSPPPKSPCGPGPKIWLQPQDLHKIHAEDFSASESIASSACDSVVDIMYYAPTRSAVGVDAGGCSFKEEPSSSCTSHDQSDLSQSQSSHLTPYVNADSVDGNSFLFKIRMLVSRMWLPKCQKPSGLTMLPFLH